MGKKTGPKPKDRKGERYGKLVAVEYVMHKGHGAWRCACDCGNESIVRPNFLKKRVGCKSCTLSMASIRRNHDIPHYGYKNRLYREYQQGAKKRNLSFELSQERFFKLLEGNCFYCGTEPEEQGGQTYMVKTLEPLKRNGIDRVNTTKGYTKKNCVSCCSKCNYAKHEMSYEAFKKWLYKLYHNVFKESSEIIP